jgi:cell division protein FtsZ
MSTPMPAEMETEVETAQLEAPVAVAPVAAPAPIVAPPMPVAAPAAPAPAQAATPGAQKPLVDETDWRVSRPVTRQVVREPMTRPIGGRPVATESRAPNLFQRITGAFAAPKPMAPTPAVGMAAQPATQASPGRPIPENVVAVPPKPAARPAPQQTSIDVTERTKPARDDDDLQIPAFLRRQAN